MPNHCLFDGKNYRVLQRTKNNKIGWNEIIGIPECDGEQQNPTMAFIDVLL